MRTVISRCMIITGSFLILYFLWLNYYGVLYNSIYSFAYENFLEGTLDETSDVFTLNQIPKVFLTGSGLFSDDDEPVLQGNSPPPSSDTSVSEDDNIDNTYNTDTLENETSESKENELSMPVIDSRSDFHDNSMIIYIPRMGVKHGVMNGTTAADLRQGPGLYDISDIPTEDSDVNVIIAAHRNGSSAFFYNIHKLKSQDYIYIYFNNKVFIYEYEETKIIEPNDWSVTARRGYSCLTLTSCHPIGSNSQRIIAFAKLIQVKDLS